MLCALCPYLQSRDTLTCQSYRRTPWGARALPVRGRGLRSEVGTWSSINYHSTLQRQAINNYKPQLVPLRLHELRVKDPRNISNLERYTCTDGFQNLSVRVTFHQEYKGVKQNCANYSSPP